MKWTQLLFQLVEDTEITPKTFGEPQMETLTGGKVWNNCPGPLVAGQWIFKEKLEHGGDIGTVT